jgi:predicted nucleic acid-binding Zn ribbon protein
MEPLHAVLPRAIRQLLRAGPMDQQKLAFAWTAAVGPVISRATAVRWCDDRVVEVTACDEAWARELSRDLPEITRRLEALVGTGVITEVRLASPPRRGRA